MLYSDRVRSALDLEREPEVLRDDYGRSALGQGALAARRLIEAGARFVTLGFGGWDTHGDNFRTLRDRLLPPLDKALAALIRDLNARGLLDETLIVCAGEFGRTPRVNGTAGRDHWPRTMSVLLAGGGHSRWDRGRRDRRTGNGSHPGCLFPGRSGCHGLSQAGFRPAS